MLLVVTPHPWYDSRGLKRIWASFLPTAPHPDMNASPSPQNRLAPRTAFGNHRIQREIGESDLGLYYEATVGTTMHAYRLLVLSPALPLDIAAVEAVVQPLADVLHPCLAKPFACGREDGRLWIRFELPQDMPFGSFSLPKTEKRNPWPVGERVANAGRLRELFQGLVPQTTLWPLMGDLLEGLASLHDAGLTLGPLELESIVFQHGRHGKGVVAQWADYGLLPLLDPAAARHVSPRGDVRVAGGLFRSLLGGDGGSLPLTSWPEWKPFLDRATQDGPDAFPDGNAMVRAFGELLAAHALRREPRKAAGETATPPQAAPKPREPRHRAHEQRKRIGAHRRRKHDNETSNTMNALLVGPAFKVLAMIGMLCLVGFLAFWFVSRDVRLRREGLIGPSVRLLTEEAVAAADLSQPETLWALSRKALEGLAGEGNPRAAMRLAFLVAQGDEENPPDEARGEALARTAAKQLEEALQVAADDADARYWLGYALLAGFGTEANPGRGLTLLEEAARQHNHVRAMELLGDYHASGAAGNPEVDDGVALQWWRGALDSFSDWDSHALVLANKAMAFIQDGRGLPRGDPAAFVKWIERQAQRQHLPSILALGTILLEGRIVSMDEPRAMHWFRTAALGGSAEGMRRMAWMFEHGIGTPQSERTALIWYRRAAVAGDPEAMERLAELTAQGRGGEDPGSETAAAWRQKAAAARAAALQRRLSFDWWRPGAPAPQSASPAAVPAPDTAAPAPTAKPDATPAAAPASADEPAPLMPLPPVPPELIQPQDQPPVPLGLRGSAKGAVRPA